MLIFDKMQQNIERAQTKGLRPLVIFDVDDTIIDCRFRKHRVFCDFARQAHIQARWPAESQAILKFPWEHLRYRVHDNLAASHISNPAFGEEIFNFWLQHYFTYPYLIQDRAFPGATHFVQRCKDLGAHIVYLTARDHPGMYQGTIEALTLLGFPMHAPEIHIMLKPEIGISDHHFKVGALEQIASLGEVIASLENELPNLNAMAERFQNAAMYWRKTLYAPDPPAPHPRVEILPHFP